MLKWADYTISSVRFNPAHTHIDQVQVRPDNGDNLGPSTTQQREAIVSLLKRGVTFTTIFRNNDQWHKGQPVFIDRVNGIEYIKTVPNGKAIDNLDNLPEF
jgi:hypothetical protein